MTEQPLAPPITPGERGTPVSTTLLEGGMRRHTMADGRIFEEGGPTFTMEYQSFVPDSTYSRDIAIFGLDPDRKHLFEAWCYVHDALRTYAFHKVISLTELETGTVVSGGELCEIMKGEMRPQ